MLYKIIVNSSFYLQTARANRATKPGCLHSKPTPISSRSSQFGCVLRQKCLPDYKPSLSSRPIGWDLNFRHIQTVLRHHYDSECSVAKT